MTITVQDCHSKIPAKASASIPKRVWFIPFAVWGFAILFARMGNSIGRIPSDPGDEYFRAAALQPIKSLFLRTDNQLIVGIRFLSELVVLFPFRYQAIVTNVLVAGVWVLASILIVQIVQSESHSKFISFIGGTLFLVAPALSESQLGNIGGIRWALYGVAAVAISSPKFRSNHVRVLLGLIVLLGLTHPLALAIFPGALHWLFVSSKVDRRKSTVILCVIVACFAVQLVASEMLGGAQIGRLNTAVFWPWDGAGAFWWFNWLFPPLLAVSCLCVHFIVRNKPFTNTDFAALLAFQSFTISFTTYALAGISDRYLIVPFVLSGTSAFIMLFELKFFLQRLYSPMLLAAVFLALVPIIKWFPAGWYLTGQQTWRSQVDSAIMKCNLDPSTEILLYYASGVSESYSCLEIFSRNS